MLCARAIRGTAVQAEARHTTAGQLPDKLRVAQRVEEGDQSSVLSQEVDLVGAQRVVHRRLLHLEHDVGRLVQGSGIGHDLGPRLAVCLVREERSFPRARLY